MKNVKWYLVFFVTALAPALVELITTLGATFEWQSTSKITATIMALAGFIGALIGYNRKGDAKDDKNKKPK